VQQPRVPAASQVDGPPQLLTFSKDMSYEQLAVWLTNHPRFVGADYQQDIAKLKGIHVECHNYYTVNTFLKK
jgi:hypothetical protein